MNEQLLTTLENSRNYTLAVAAAMPAGSYDKKVAPAAWSFGELLNHIAYGISWWQDNYIRKRETAWAPPPGKKDKDAIIKELDKAYDVLKDILGKSKLTEETTNGFHSTLDHITHHRGQAVLHLRYNGIEPPEYRY